MMFDSVQFHATFRAMHERLRLYHRLLPRGLHEVWIGILILLDSTWRAGARPLNVLVLPIDKDGSEVAVSSPKPRESFPLGCWGTVLVSHHLRFEQDLNFIIVRAGQETRESE